MNNLKIEKFKNYNLKFFEFLNLKVFKASTFSKHQTAVWQINSTKNCPKFIYFPIYFFIEFI